ADCDPHCAAIPGAKHRSDRAAHPPSRPAAPVSHVALSAARADRRGQLHLHFDLKAKLSARGSLRRSHSGSRNRDLHGESVAARRVAVWGSVDGRWSLVARKLVWWRGSARPGRDEAPLLVGGLEVDLRMMSAI